MRQTYKLLFAAAACVAIASAQPVVNAVVNSAKYGIPGLPGYGVAQGSMATIFGTGFPNSTKQVSAWPLTNPWEGVTIKITVSGTTVDGYAMILQGPNQMTILVPSNTPVGTGTITVAYNGQTSAPAPITVMASNFGIFTRNFSGQGPGIFLDPINGNRDNNISNSARPGSTILDIWGTGLGPVAGSELAGPVAGNQNIPMEVYIGGVRVPDADIQYRGRSGCCAGIDQVRVKVPASAPTGCYVPVTVIIGDAVSNTVSMAVGTNGGTCSDVNGLSSALVNQAATGGTIRIGDIDLSRIGLKLSMPGIGTITSNTDSANGFFSRYDFTKLSASSTGIGITPFGACTVYTMKGNVQVPTDITQPTPLDAGATLTLTGPKGSKTLTKGQGGYYSADLGGGFDIPGIPLPGGTAGPPYLDPGSYTIRGTGGADVGAFTATLNVPTPLVWTNMDAITTIRRSQGVTVTWTGGGANDYVMITGISMVDKPENAIAGFNCTERASAGTFTVPRAVLLALPVNAGGGDTPMGFLSVASSTQPVSFTATGLDLGQFQSIVSSSKTVTYQ